MEVSNLASEIISFISQNMGIALILLVSCAAILIFSVSLMYALQRVLPIFAYVYPNTRLQIMGKNLLGDVRRRELVENSSAKDIESIAEQAQYKLFGQEIGKKSDSSSIERASSLEKGYGIANVLSFIPKKSKPIIELFEKERELEILKSAIRIINSAGNSTEGMMGTFPDTKRFSSKRMQELLKSKDMNELAINIKDTEYGNALEGAMESYNKTKNAFFLETALDRQYFESALLSVECAYVIDREIAREYFAMKADCANIMTALRLAGHEIYKEIMKECFIPCSKHITIPELEKMALSKSASDALKIASGTRYEDDALAGLEALEKNGSLSAFQSRLDAMPRKMLNDCAKARPFSIAVALNYLSERQHDINVMRAALLAHAAGVDIDDEDFLLA